MSHVTAQYLLGGVFLAIAAAVVFFTRKRTRATGEIVAPVALGLCGVIALLTGVVDGSSSRTESGSVEAVTIVETEAGPRVVTIDVIEHFDPLALLSKRGGSTWQEHRLNAFDLATGERVLRLSLDGSETPSPVLAGDLGGFAAVKQSSQPARLLSLEDGHELGGLEQLTARILSLNPSFKALRSTPRYSSESRCLEIETAEYSMRLDPRHLRPVEARSCRPDQAGVGATKVVFGPGSSFSVVHVEPPLPPGATARGDNVEGFVQLDGTSTRVKRPDLFKFPRFANDSRTGEPIFLGEARAALLLHGNGELSAAAVAPSAAVLWEVPLPTRLGELTLLNGALVALSLEGKAVVIDAATGKARAFPLD